jgi:hypothetical protein
MAYNFTTTERSQRTVRTLHSSAEAFARRAGRRPRASFSQIVNLAQTEITAK